MNTWDIEAQDEQARAFRYVEAARRLIPNMSDTHGEAVLAEARSIYEAINSADYLAALILANRAQSLLSLAALWVDDKQGVTV